MSGNACEPVIATEIVDRYTLIPSFLVILSLHSFQYYKEKRFEIVPPFFSLLDDTRNKKLIMVAFGAMTSSFANVMIHGFKPTINTWVDASVYICLYVLKFLVIAAINYPIFMCIAAPYKMPGSVLGIIFICYRLAFFFVTNSEFKSCSGGISKTDQGLFNNVRTLPSAICYFILLFNFSKNVMTCITRRNFHERTKDMVILGNNHHFEHLKCLLSKAKDEPYAATTPFYLKPWRLFKETYVHETPQLSTVFISALITTITLYYYLIVQVIWNMPTFLKQFKFEGIPGAKTLSNGLFVIYILAFTVSILTYVVILFKITRSHRQDLRDMFAGRMKSSEYLHNLSPQSLVMSNILFPGYFVAYMVWGFFSLFVGMYVIAFLLYSLVVLVIESHEFWSVLVYILRGLYSVFTIPLLVYIIQLLMTYCFFCPRNAVSLRSLRNVKIYHVTIYFNFFYNILIGVTSCIFRSIMALMINLLLLGRIDRSPYAFFKSFDSGYRAYISFLRLQGLYKNPLMRCFVQMLHEVQEQSHEMYPPSDKMTSSIDKKIRNRWHLAYTLIHNPSLKNLRRRQASTAVVERNRCDVALENQFDMFCVNAPTQLLIDIDDNTESI